MADNKEKGKEKLREGEKEKRKPIKEWTKEDVQKWFKKKDWENRGQFFHEANRNNLIALSKEFFKDKLGELCEEAVYGAI